MRTSNWYKPCGIACTLIFLCLAAVAGRGAVKADPAQVTFGTPDQSFTIKLSRDGLPVPAEDIQGWQFLASGHDYKHMLNLVKLEGAVRISPSDTVELGSYDLSIETAQGPAVVQVLTPLSEVPDIVEKLAALTGASEQKIAEKLGLTSTTGRSEIQINLPSVYYEGQSIEIEMPSGGGGHSCMWFINGDAVAQGPDEYAFSHTLTEPDDYVLTFIETVKEDGKDVVTAVAKAYTRVVPRPAVSTGVAANTAITYKPPPGYQTHAWSLDGEPVSGETNLRHTFLAPGEHIVECLASDPDQGPGSGYVRIRYNTTVTPA